MDILPVKHSSAVQDFRRARSRAKLQQIVARLTGGSAELLSYEEVRQAVRASGVVSRTLREIPLDAIIGSVGRYRDFTRSFLPRLDSDEERWARVKVAQTDLGGLPPVEVYQIGEAYFVHDGHHRVSVVRQLGAQKVEAYVTEIRSKVPLPADIQPDELILTAEYAEFLAITHLDELASAADLAVTEVGQYAKLLEHIEVHRHFMGIEQQQEIPYADAVAHWYDTVYIPVVQIIRELEIMNEFPDRTETDLYLWIAKHRSDIESVLNWDITYAAAAVDLAEQQSGRWSRIASRLGRRVLEIAVPGELEPEPSTGQWRKERAIDPSVERLFADILVPLGHEDDSWIALEQAIGIAEREGSELHGLHVVSEEAQLEQEDIQAIRDRFEWRCGEVGLPCSFTVDVGPIARTISSKARWVDLVVTSLAHPPESSAVSRYSSGFRQLISRCSRPILAVPGLTTSLSRPMLAYDGSIKAQEALFVATYLAETWQLPLTIITVSEAADGSQNTIAEARRYLDGRVIEATFIAEGGPAVKTILEAAAENKCDLLIMGGYGVNPVVEVVRGTVVDEILAGVRIPVLVCQ